VDAGHSHFTGAADGQVRLTPGTLVLVPAHRVHACNPAPGQAWSYQMLHVDADWLTQLRLESGLAVSKPANRRVSAGTCGVSAVLRVEQLLFSSACNGEKDAALIAFSGTWTFQRTHRWQRPPPWKPPP
jgi:hypothetical protein